VLRDSLGLNNQALFLTEMLGHPPNQGMMKALYRLADVMILPSFEEGFGLPILEAGLARLPIFCADILALREVAGDDAHYFSPHAKADSVAEQIAQMLTHETVGHLHRRVLNDYDWTRIVRRYIEPLIANIR
jgi:glycosyltransferase involved in cell wall biosynthesis